MLPVSAMSDAANKLRNLLLDRIDDLDDVKRIRIGHPKDTLEDMEKDKDKNHLNLFFYNVSYDGYPADGLSEDPFYVRLHCLITAVGAKKGSPSAGENDLRLIGEVMRVLHQQPVISVDDGNNGEIAQLQIVPHPLNLDNLNHIWSTQGDTAYRLSVAYEMALAPIPLTEAVERSSLVGEIGTRVQGDMDREPLPAGGFGIPASAPIVPGVKVDASRSNWTPHVCFVYLNACAYTLAFKEGSQALMDFLPRIWVAADANARIDLVWEKWQSDSGWQVVSRRKNIFSVSLAMHFGSTNIYAGTNGGGVFKSVDSGENWVQKKVGLSDLNVQFLSIDPGTPATVYVGTNGGGVFKSVDSGEHWVQKKAGLSDLNVQFIAIDPGTPATVYAGTNGGGVFKSVDGGNAWDKVGRIPIGLNDDVLTIAPDIVDSAETFQESMPDKLSPGQAMLYAVRIYKRIHDGYATEARSNPLLVTVYEAGA
jgi:hypothetical protein